MAEKMQTQFPFPPTPATACTVKQSKKRKSVLEKATNRKIYEKKIGATRVNIGIAFQRWRQLRELKGLKTDAMVAVFLLDRCAASLQNHEPDNETSRGHPPLTKNDSPELAPHNVCVNMACLLQLFRQCGQCSGECVVRKQGDKRHFTVMQHCQICNLLTTWTSQPLKEDEESVDICEVTEGNQEFTASLMMREWFDSKTDTASSREESLLTDEDIKVIRPAKLAEAEVSVVLPCEVRKGDQESTASMTTTMGSQSDGGPSRKTSLLTEDEKKEKDQESDNKFDPFAEVELTIDSDFSDESQMSQEDSDGGEEGGEEAEEKGEGGVENKNIEKEEEAENKASSREESLLTDEDIKVIRPAEVAAAEESVILPCEVREGDQESMETMGSQTDGGPSRKTSLLTEDEKKEKGQKSENKLHSFAERVERTIDSDLSDESQMSQEDSDGGKEKVEEGEDVETKGEGEVNNKEEAEYREESETEEEDECESDDDAEESEQEMDEVRKVWKRLRGDDHYRHYNRKYMMYYRRKYMMKREQKRPETLCTNCGRLYKTLSHKCDPKKKFQCSDCGVFFLTELSLSVHRNGHCRSHYDPCTFCLKPFKTRKDKLAHEMSHSGENPYECPECPLRFSDRSTRSRHLKEHPKTFRCQTCQKEFPILRLLQRHEMSHSTNKPFKCQMCDRVFAQASQLKSHLRVHTGEKPFHCQLCPKCFNHNISLKNHIRRYHQGESHDNPGPALREQEEGYHGPEPEADDGAEQERVEGREMKHGRSQKQEDVTFWTELDIAQRGNSLV